jgi:guanylate cyclase soluble subunit alpha
MACPFSGLSQLGSGNNNDDNHKKESDKQKYKNPLGHDRQKKDEKLQPCRQSSVQITSSLLGEDIEEQTETQTLNLKHLKAAVLMLTNPSVRQFR